MRLSVRKNERGASVAEFAIVALTFFTLIIGIIEFGRLLYTHNALTDATRRGARYAAINKQTDEAKVIDLVVYGPNVTYDPDTGDPTSAPLIPGLTTDMVEVDHEGADLDGVPATLESGYGTNLGTATVRIEGYQFQLLIPVVGRQLDLGTYETILTAESAGEDPDDIAEEP